MALRTSTLRAALVVLPTALLALAAIGRAQTGDQPQMMASFICRPALSNETATAKMMNSSTTLVCKPFAVNVTSADGSLKTIGNVSVKAPSSPNFGGALTAQQINAAYTDWVRKTFYIDPAREHTN